MSESSSSDSDLFPGAEYVEDAPIPVEIAEIGTKPVSEVLAELGREVGEARKKEKAVGTERVTIADKLNKIREEQLEEDRKGGRKQLRGKDEVGGEPFKRPKMMPKGPF